MKRYIIILVGLICFSCKARSTYPMNVDYQDYLKNNNYIKDTNNDLNKFVGIWKWVSPTNPNTYFEVHFVKVNQWKHPSNKMKYYMDKIFGNYKYVENGITITNTLNRNDYSYTNILAYPNMMSNSDALEFKELFINMNDVAKNNKFCKAQFEIINLGGSPLQAIWKMIETGQIRINPTTPVAPAGFSIPTNIVLIKQ